MAERAKELTGKLGVRNCDLAEYFEVSEPTIDNWIKNNLEFQRAVNQGRTDASLTVAMSLFDRAIGVTITEETIIKNEVKEYHPNGKLKRTYIEPIVVQTQKQLPPESWAAVKFLSHVRRDIWTDNNNINIDHTINANVNVKQIEELNLDELSEPVKNLLFELNMKQLSDGQSN